MSPEARSNDTVDRLVAFAKGLLRFVVEPLWLLFAVHRILRAGQSVRFIHEGPIDVRLPRVGYGDVMTGRGRRLVRQCMEFMQRPRREVLLRCIVHFLYAKGRISRRASIIDIGAWLGDNTIVWSQFIDSASAVVYAVDPSPLNLDFGKRLANLNDCRNINWVQAVCSDVCGKLLAYEGDLEHASFVERGEGPHVQSTTLDEVVGRECWGSIGLLHVDVEGLELQVLQGASRIIEHSSPLILFEQHISHDNVGAISRHLAAVGYELHMINEVLPGCALDCRNFLAAPKDFDLSGLTEDKEENHRWEDVWCAVPGAPLATLAAAAFDSGLG